MRCGSAIRRSAAFKLEEILREAFQRSGKDYDVRMYSLLRNEFFEKE